MARIHVFTGHFGSGKTEIALNYALQTVEENSRVCVVDMDIVNPYFCSRDLRDRLEHCGVRVISPNPALANAELGIVTPEVMAAFNDKTLKVVIDVGGNDVGALALGQFRRYFEVEPYEMCFVINTNRPDTATKADVLDCMSSIERASRLKVTHLIANTNLSYETTVADVVSGDSFVASLAKELQLPHKFTVCREDMRSQVEPLVQGPILAIEIFMKPPWM